MKRGLNFTDVNTLKAGLSMGYSLQEIARICSIPDVSVVQRYVDSMPAEVVADLRAQAPAQAQDVASMKAEMMAELRKEMGMDAKEDTRSPQQKAADTRKANKAAAELLANGPDERPSLAGDDVLAEMRAEANANGPVDDVA